MSDIYGDQTVLLLHCEGANASTVFQDSSYSNIVTAVGKAQISTAQKKFGASSAYFDGTTSYLTVPDSENWTFGAGDFTVEFFVKPVSNASTQLLLQHAGGVGQYGWSLAYRSTGAIYFWYSTTGSDSLGGDSVPCLTFGNWSHIAMCRTGGFVKIYCDGVVVYSLAVAATIFNSTGLLNIGGNSSSSSNTYMDEVRITKGVARYTADFTPPTTAFDDPTIQRADDLPLYWDQTKLLLHMDGPNGATYFRDERHNGVSVQGDTKISNVQSKFGGASAYFDGDQDYLNIDDFGASGAFGIGNFTIECWVYSLGAYVAPRVILDKVGIYANANVDFRLEISSAGYLGFLGGPNVTWHGSVAATYVPNNRWVHIAVVRDGSVISFFIDGVLAHSQAASFNIGNLKGQLRIGSMNNSGAAGNYFNGYLEEIRITSGVARYTTRFVPQTKAFSTPVTTDSRWASNVVLAIPGTGKPGGPADIIDLKGHAITFTGDTKISAAKSKFNGSSIYFDGTGDYFTVAAHTDFSFGTGDFTIEMFAYFNADSYGSIFRLGTNLIVLEKTGTVGAFSYSLSGSGNTIGSSTPIGTWHHIAAVRISGVFYLYINGVQKSSMAFTTNLAANQSMRFGADNVGTGSLLNGYLQGIRATKGVGRYTGAFTPPSEPFPSAVPQALSGVVHDSSGNPIQRTARSYRRDTGQLIGTAVSDPITGLFSLPADNTDEHFVVVFDDTKNALVYDHIVPVI